MDYILQLAEYKQNYINSKDMKYNEINSIISSCIKTNNSIIYDLNISPFLFQDEQDIIIIYSSSPLILANNITNAIFETYTKYVSLTTQLINREFVINIDNYNYIYIILFTPITKVNFYNIPSSLIVSMIFKKIYSIEYFYKMDHNDINNIIVKCKKKLITGGDIAINRNELKCSIIQKIYEKMTIEGDIIKNVAFLSYYQEILENNLLNFNNTIDIIYMNNTILNKIALLIKDIVSDYKKYILKIYHHKNFNIVNDFRLKKISIYLEKKDRSKDKIYLCNLYNSGTYELIPVLSNQNLLVSKYVALRFLYLDLFFIEYISPFKSVLINKIKFLLDLNEDYNNIIWKGIYRNEKMDKIITNLKCGKDIVIYRPWVYFSINKTLRVLTSR